MIIPNKNWVGTDSITQFFPHVISSTGGCHTCIPSMKLLLQHVRLGGAVCCHQTWQAGKLRNGGSITRGQSAEAAAGNQISHQRDVQIRTSSWDPSRSKHQWSASFTANSCLVQHVYSTVYSCSKSHEHHNPPTWLATWHKPPSLHRSNGHWYPIHGTQKINRSTHHLLSCHASELFFHFLHSKIQRWVMSWPKVLDQMFWIKYSGRAPWTTCSALELWCVIRKTGKRCCQFLFGCEGVWELVMFVRKVLKLCH